MANETETDEVLELWSEFLYKTMKNGSRSTQITFTVVLLIIFVISVVGNLLTCIVMYCDKTMHTATNYYLFNLAASDLIVTLTILLEVQDYISDTYIFGRVGCKVYSFLVNALWNTNILTITALAIERCVVIRNPLLLKSASVYRRVRKIILVIWFLALIMTLPEYFLADLAKIKGVSICLVWPSTLARVLYGILAVLTFVVPMGIMTVVYAKIAFKVNDAEKKTRREQIFNHRDNRSKVNTLVVALTLSFLVCWLPYFIIRMMIFVLDVRQMIQLSEWWGTAFKVAMVNSWASSVLNPLLFSLISTKFRTALKTLWTTKCKRKHIINQPINQQLFIAHQNS